VVLDSQTPHIKAVEMAAKKSRLEVDVYIDTSHMAELMSQADLAIGASGSSSWERCFLGLPAINYVIADNQKPIAKELAKSGASITIQSTEDLSVAIGKLKESLSAFSMASAELVYGMGVLRVIDKLCFNYFTISTNNFDLKVKDLKKLSRQKIIEVLEARNHPEVRANMFNKNIISLEEHLAFIENLLADTTSRHFFVSQDEKFVGVVNLRDIDWMNKSASFGIYANLLNKVDMAGEKLMVAADFLIKKMGLSLITLMVESKNHKAQNLYEKWGYKVVGSKKVNGFLYINYEKTYA